MPNLSEITIMGHVGKDPMCPSPNHPDFMTFTVCVNTKDKDKNKIPFWYECNTRNEFQRKFVEQYVKKGGAIYVRGKPKFDSYQDKQGKAQVAVKIAMDDFHLLGDSKKDDQPATSYKKVDVTIHDFGDEIPF